ncbi:phosphodiester glycosidase family protein [Treponema sp. R80B11-R83G3]
MRRIFVGSWFALFSIILVFSSCATISPVNSAKDTPSVFSTVENIKPQWQVFANGIDYFHGKISSPALEFWALKIDLSAQELDIVVKGGAFKGNQTLSKKVSNFVRDNNLLAGINSVPFDIVSSKEGKVIQNMGIVISNGKITAPANPSYDALVFYKDGKAAIVAQSAITSVENIENAIGGFHQILTGGELAQRTHDKRARHPRSAAGISQDGKYLYLAVIDGRRAGSVGATEEETALLLRSLGSWEGLNFDGGGSTALAMRFADGKIRVVNTPIHGGIPKQERAVAGCLGVR